MQDVEETIETEQPQPRVEESDITPGMSSGNNINPAAAATAGKASATLKLWPNKSSKKMKVTETVDQCLALALTNLTKPSPPPSAPTSPNGHGLFGQIVANELRQMDDEQAILARRLMNEICFLGRVKNLKVNHNITDLDLL